MSYFHVISDILYNSSASILKACDFRKRFLFYISTFCRIEFVLPIIVSHFHQHLNNSETTSQREFIKVLFL